MASPESPAGSVRRRAAVARARGPDRPDSSASGSRRPPCRCHRARSSLRADAHALSARVVRSWRVRCRRALARLPHTAIEHQRLCPLRDVSRKWSGQGGLAHLRMRPGVWVMTRSRSRAHIQAAWRAGSATSGVSTGSPAVRDSLMRPRSRMRFRAVVSDPDVDAVSGHGGRPAGCAGYAHRAPRPACVVLGHARGSLTGWVAARRVGMRCRGSALRPYFSRSPAQKRQRA